MSYAGLLVIGHWFTSRISKEAILDKSKQSKALSLEIALNGLPLKLRPIGRCEAVQQYLLQ